MITCSGVKFFDHGSVVLPVQVGKELLQVFRDLINENFTELIVDGHFIPHISVFRKNTMDDISKEQLGQSLDGHNTVILILAKVKIRTLACSQVVPIGILIAEHFLFYTLVIYFPCG